jgi:hypothetical protein
MGKEGIEPKFAGVSGLEPRLDRQLRTSSSAAMAAATH